MKITKDMMKQAIRPFYNETGIYDVRDVESKAKGHFFEPNAMRFFNSRLVDEVFPSRGKVYFVTSEKFDHKSPRMFTVRVLDLESRGIETVGEFQAYSSRTQALTAALNCAYDNLENSDR